MTSCEQYVTKWEAERADADCSVVRVTHLGTSIVWAHEQIVALRAVS